MPIGVIRAIPDAGVTTDGDSFIIQEERIPLLHAIKYTTLAGAFRNIRPFVLTTDDDHALRVNVIAGGGGGGTQYAEDTTHVSGDLVNMAGVVQQTADAALSGDGDRSLLQVDASGFLKVNIKAGAGSGGTAMTDDAAFTVGTTSFTPAGGTFRSVRDLVDDNDGGAFAMTQRRAILSCIETPAGDSAMDEANDAIRVNIVAGAGSGGTAQADKSSFVEGTTSFTPVGGVFNETITADPTEDQAAAARITAKRAIHANLRNNSGAEVGTAGAPLRIDPTGTTTQPVSGTVAVSGTSTVAISQTGTNNDVDVLTLPALATGSNNIGSITNVTGTVSLPTGASTLAEQQTQTTSLQLIDDTVNAINTAFSKAVCIGGQLDDTAPTAATENNIAPIRITAQRAQHVNLRDNAGAELGVSGAPVRVDPTGTTIQPVNGTVSANLNAGTNNIGDVDVLTLPALPTGSNTIGTVNLGTIAGIALDATLVKLTIAQGAALGTNTQALAGGSVTTAAPTYTTGQVSPFSLTTAGGLRVDGSGVTQPVSGTVSVNLNAGTNNVGDVDVLTVPANMTVDLNRIAGTATVTAGVSGLLAVGGNVADNVAITANSIRAGLTARSTNPTVATDGRHMSVFGDRVGRLVSQLHQCRDLYTAPTTTTISTTTETTILAAVASTFLDLTYLSISNTSNTTTRVDIRDSTAGTIRFSQEIGPKGGWSIPLNGLATQATVNTNWTAQLSVAVTDIRVNIIAVKNA